MKLEHEKNISNIPSPILKKEKKIPTFSAR